MKTINLRWMYPHYRHDEFVDVTDEVWAAMYQAQREMENYERRKVYHRAYYSLDALMLMAMFEQPTLKDTIQVLMEVQPLVAEDAEMAALVQQTIPKMQRLTEPQFKGLELEWYKPEEPNKKTEVAEK